MTLKQGSMREAIDNIYQALINDEELLRLLYYLPKSAKNPSPLSDNLDNIIGSDKYWDIVDDRIMISEKTSDLIDREICRIYIASGRRRPVYNNYLMAKQEVIISVYTHLDFDADGRQEWIADRINELIALERISGIGMLDYVKGDPYVAPRQYKNYRHIYQFTIGKK